MLVIFACANATYNFLRTMKWILLYDKHHIMNIANLNRQHKTSPLRLKPNTVISRARSLSFVTPPTSPLLIRAPQLKREQQVFPQESSRVWLSQPFSAKRSEEGGPAVMESYPTERKDTAHALILTHSTGTQKPGRSQDKLAPASQTTEAHLRARDKNSLQGIMNVT